MTWSSRSLDLGTSRPDQLRRLLALAAAPRTLDALAAGVEPTSTAVHLLAEIAGGDVALARRLFETVSAGGTPVEALRDIKELAKQLVARADTAARRSAAELLYLGAVAAAAGRGAGISSIPAAERAPLYARLADALGDEPLGAVFAEAAARARAT